MTSPSVNSFEQPGFPMTRLTPPYGSDRMFVPQRKSDAPQSCNKECVLRIYFE